MNDEQNDGQDEAVRRADEFMQQMNALPVKKKSKAQLFKEHIRSLLGKDTGWKGDPKSEPRTVIGGIFWGNRETRRRHLKLQKQQIAKKKNRAAEIRSRTAARKNYALRYFTGKYSAEYRPAFLKLFNTPWKELKGSVISA